MGEVQLTADAWETKLGEKRKTKPTIMTSGIKTSADLIFLPGSIVFSITPLKIICQGANLVIKQNKQAKIRFSFCQISLWR